jgi:hypothetical protein
MPNLVSPNDTPHIREEPHGTPHADFQANAALTARKSKDCQGLGVRGRTGTLLVPLNLQADACIEALHRRTASKGHFYLLALAFPPSGWGLVSDSGTIACLELLW